MGQLLQFRFPSGSVPASSSQAAAGLAFLLISKIYRQMYADTGIATDSARVSWSGRWARWLAKPCRRLFAGAPMPHLAVPSERTSGPGDEPHMLRKPVSSAAAG